MSKVTSKLQVTLPKALAEKSAAADVRTRLRLFDQATARLAGQRGVERPRRGVRGWTREDLYERDRARPHQHPFL